MPATRPNQRARYRAIGWSVAVAVLMLAGKLTAAAITGSAAIYSDAAESVIHLFATGFAAFSLWYASTPADESHPYGHGKIAYFASAVEGLLILVAALTILYTAIQDLVRGPSLDRLGTGLYILLGLTLVNLGLGAYLVHTGRKHNSLVLVSNGQHVLTDMWTSVGVIGGVALVWLTGIEWLDPVAAILVALNILWTAGQLLRRSVYGLMEKADPESTARIFNVLNEALENETIVNFHQVRYRRVSDEVWIEYHLLFPGKMSIEEAHARSHAVEDEIATLFPRAEVHVTAHLEPARHDEAHPPHHVEPSDPLYEAQHGA